MSIEHFHGTVGNNGRISTLIKYIIDYYQTTAYLMKETIKNIIYLARRFKLATTLNMMGLVVAFAAFYILMTQVIYQGSYNHSIEDYERLYRMESDFT